MVFNMEDFDIRELTKKIYNSRLRIFQKHPFFGVFLSTFKFNLDNSIYSFSTDGKIMYFNPCFLNNLSEFELDLTILHSLLHVILKHPYRYYTQLDDKLFHYACDIVVNSNIYSALGLSDNLYIQGRLLAHICPNGDEGYLHTAEEVFEMLKQSKNQSSADNQSNEKADTSNVNAKPYTEVVMRIKSSYTGKFYMKREVYNTYKDRTLDIIYNNPYDITYKINEIKFPIIDKLRTSLKIKIQFYKH